MAGPLTQADILAIWKSVVDPEYARPLIEGGDGNGLEVYSQGFAQLERASQAIDRATQAMYIRPWSGQTAPPAGGGARAVVPLTFGRTNFADQTLILGTGTLVEEVATIESEAGGVATRTGRQYGLSADVVFPAGATAPQTGSATAARDGYGFNNPMVGTITGFVQPGTLFNHDGASVLVSGFASPDAPNQVRLRAQNEPDVPIPAHVGQYLQFTAGANVGRVFRAVGYGPPDPSIGSGGELVLDVVGDVEVNVTVGPGFIIGEKVSIDSGHALGVVLAFVPGARPVLVLRLLAGVLLLGSVVAAAGSGTSATVTQIHVSPSAVAEVGTAAWRILDWGLDWGLTVSNTARPAGGALGVLDALGAERGVARAPAEPDDSYRARVAEVADVISPNAIRRTLNRTLGQGNWFFSEVGLSWPGFYFEQDPYDHGSLVAHGAFFDPHFLVDERVELRRADASVKATGWVIQWAGGGATVNFRDGQWVWEAGCVLVGLSSGTVYTLFSIDPPDLSSYRKHDLLDYQHMRATIFVDIIRANDGEYGFPYDALVGQNAFDAGVTSGNFFDGEPYLWGRRNLAAFAALSAVKAAGVTLVFQAVDPV